MTPLPPPQERASKHCCGSSMVEYEQKRSGTCCMLLYSSGTAVQKILTGSPIPAVCTAHVYLCAPNTNGFFVTHLVPLRHYYNTRYIISWRARAALVMRSTSITERSIYTCSKYIRNANARPVQQQWRSFIAAGSEPTQPFIHLSKNQRTYILLNYCCIAPMQTLLR